MKYNPHSISFTMVILVCNSIGNWLRTGSEVIEEVSFWLSSSTRISTWPLSPQNHSLNHDVENLRRINSSMKIGMVPIPSSNGAKRGGAISEYSLIRGSPQTRVSSSSSSQKIRKKSLLLHHTKNQRCQSTTMIPPPKLATISFIIPPVSPRAVSI